MNYARSREAAKLNKFVKQKLLEKQSELRSLHGSERERAEKLLIAQAKKEYSMGYKNDDELKKEKKPVEPPAPPLDPVDPPVITPPTDATEISDQVPPLDAPPLDLESLSKLGKGKLVEELKVLGVEFDETKTKNEILESLKGK